MQLKELKERIDEMYNKYDDVAVLVDIRLHDKDDTVCLFCGDNNEIDTVSTEDIQDITELKNHDGSIVTGICLSNYIMEDKNWGKEDKNV